MRISNILTGLKLDSTHLSSVFLLIGTTDAILALFLLLGKLEVLILLLMAIGSGSAKVSDANLTGFVVILSIPDALLEFRDFRMVLIFLGVILEPQLEEGIKMERDCKFLFLCISTIIG